MYAANAANNVIARRPSSPGKGLHGTASSLAETNPRTHLPLLELVRLRSARREHGRDQGVLLAVSARLCCGPVVLLHPEPPAACATAALWFDFWCSVRGGKK